MSTTHFAFRATLAFAGLLFIASTAMAAPLKPFKDELFGYGTLLESADDGDYIVVDYHKERDIHERDEIPERRVKRAYVSLGVKRSQVNETIDTDGQAMDILRVGPETGAKFSVIFIHGRGGDRRLGANDFTFGGNFNRLKNLAVENGGTYYAPTVRSFDEAGMAQVAALISYAKRQSGGRPVVLSCASMGTFICWGITRDAAAVANLKGMMIMSGPADTTFEKSAAYKARLPMFFSHGGDDPVYPATDQAALYRELKAKKYPTRFVLFQTGSHGTPVRMTDWRDALNWIGLD